MRTHTKTSGYDNCQSRTVKVSLTETIFPYVFRRWPAYMHTRTHDTSAAAARMYVARVEPVTKTVNCVNYY